MDFKTLNFTQDITVVNQTEHASSYCSVCVPEEFYDKFEKHL